MYDYRRMTAQQRAEVLSERKVRRWPWHAPPHFGDERQEYMITAACYEHRHVLAGVARLSEFAEAVVCGLEEGLGSCVHGWVVLPNHYHILADVDLHPLRRWLGRLHNGKSTQWNREDGTPGRKVWHRFSDRRIRSERHHYASLNYIHANPVKHRYVDRPEDWAWSSLHAHLEQLGPDVLAEWQIRYPVCEYGRGWDD